MFRWLVFFAGVVIGLVLLVTYLLGIPLKLPYPVHFGPRYY